MNRASRSEATLTAAVSSRHAVIPAEFLNADDQRAQLRAQRAATARRASGRRRMIDPTTCDRDYSGDELEFMQAMQAFKQASGRPFPTWGEVLGVIQGLGYHKPAVDSGPARS